MKALTALLVRARTNGVYIETFTNELKAMRFRTKLTTHLRNNGLQDGFTVTRLGDTIYVYAI